MMRIKNSVLAVIIISLLVILVAGCANKLTESQESGKQLFASYCTRCHFIDGQGNQQGIDLSSIGSRRDEEWLKRWIKNPKSINPASQMPALALTDDQISDIADYLSTVK